MIFLQCTSSQGGNGAVQQCGMQPELAARLVVT